MSDSDSELSELQLENQTVKTPVAELKAELDETKKKMSLCHTYVAYFSEIVSAGRADAVNPT
jgi:hypothetical protein